MLSMYMRCLFFSVYLTSSDAHQRCRAIQLLADVLHKLPKTYLSNKEGTQGWKLQNISAFPSEMCQKDLPVRHYFYLSWTGRQTVNLKLLAFPSEKCLKFLLVRFYFYLSRTGGQSIISIPGTSYQASINA